MTRIRAQRLVLVSAALAFSGGASLAAGIDEEPLPRPGTMQEPVQGVEAEQAEHFSILRRPQGEADRLPAAAVEFLRGATGDRGGAPDLARLARTSAGLAVWVIPAHGYLCTYAAEEGVEGGGGGCQSTEQVLDGYSISAMSPAPGATRLIGLVPDGVGEVVLRAKDGAVARAAPEGNVYVFETVHLPAQVEWGGRVIPAMSPLELP